MEVYVVNDLLASEIAGVYTSMDGVRDRIKELLVEDPENLVETGTLEQALSLADEIGEPDGRGYSTYGNYFVIERHEVR